MPTQPTSNTFRMGAILADLPAGYADEGVYTFRLPRDARDEATEKLAFSASGEPSKENAAAVVAEIVARMDIPDLGIVVTKNQETSVDGYAAQLLEFHTGNGPTDMSRQLIVDLGQRRFLSVMYLTFPDEDVHASTWKTLVTSIRLPPFKKLLDPVSTGYRRRQFPELILDIPVRLQRAEVYTFSREGESELTFAMIPYDRPAEAGQLSDDVLPLASDAVHANSAKTDQAPDSGSVQTYSVIAPRGRAQRNQIALRTMKVFPGRCSVSIEVRTSSKREMTTGSLEEQLHFVADHVVLAE